MSSAAGGRRDNEDIDARFAEIVAGLEFEPAPDQAPGDADDRDHPRPGHGEGPHDHLLEVNPAPRFGADPAERGRAEAGDAGPLSESDEESAAPPESTSESERELAGWRDAMGVDQDDQFVPLEPEPLPAGDLQFWAILIGLTLGPVLTLLGYGFRAVPASWGMVGAAMSVTGFALLILRAPKDRDDDGTGGARV